MIEKLNILGVLLVVCVACSSTSVNSNDIELDNSETFDTINEFSSNVSTVKPDNIDSLISKSYFNQAFLSELNLLFDSNNSKVNKRHELAPNISLEEYEGAEYFYLVLNLNGNRKVLHGSDIIHCKALFGELEAVLSNSFIWSYSGGCGSGEKRTWIEYNFEGEFLNSTNELMWVDEKSSTVLFKVLYKQSEIFALNTDNQEVWKAIELENEETFYEGYNWVFSKVNDEMIQGVYYSSTNDTIFIDLNK